MLLRHWVSLLMTITILISVGIFIKQYDVALLREVKALLTIMFGLATSFLLLSFIWLLQKESLRSQWNGLNALDAPSMHPRGRQSSLQSILDGPGRSTLCSISSAMEKPPNYEDALINSKPLNWQYLPIEKDKSFIIDGPTCLLANSSDRIFVNLCPVHQYSVANHELNNLQVTATRDGCTCSSGPAISCDSFKLGHKRSTSHNVAQFAFNIIRGLTHHETSGNSNRHNEVDQSFRPNNSEFIVQENCEKFVYSQLDPNQLMLCGSPPKYTELELNGYFDEPSSGHHQYRC